MRKVLWCTVAVNASIALIELITARWHEDGHAHHVLGYVNGLGHILQLPGFTFAGFVGLRPGHFWNWPAFWCALGVNVLFYGIVFGAWARWVIRFTAAPAPRTPEEVYEATAEGRELESQFSRRRLMVNGGRLVAGSAAVVGAWGVFGEARWFEITQRAVRIKGLPPTLAGLRIVQLSDIHHGSWMSDFWVRQIIDTTNKLAPDLVALTGDYVYRGPEYMEPIAAHFARLKPRVGTLGVMGNHDWWGGSHVCQRAFAKYGIPLIDNSRKFVTPERKLVDQATEGLCVAGVGDLWEDHCLYEMALGGLPGGMPRVVLSHNPDVAEEPDFLRGGYRVDLMLSGHTHGGQIRLPVIGAPVTNSRLGQKYAQGLVQGPACPVFVSRGLGMTVMPVRLGVRPEIAVIDLLPG